MLGSSPAPCKSNLEDQPLTAPKYIEIVHLCAQNVQIQPRVRARYHEQLSGNEGEDAGNLRRQGEASLSAASTGSGRYETLVHIVGRY